MRLDIAAVAIVFVDVLNLHHSFPALYGHNNYLKMCMPQPLQTPHLSTCFMDVPCVEKFAEAGVVWGH
jgi:hypothetical protein